MKLRPSATEDREAIIGLIDGIYREYGDRICLERADSDLLCIEDHYEDGLFRVLDDDGRVRGTVALDTPSAAGPVCQLKRLYLETALRGGGWGARMIDWALKTARDRNMKRLEFWSDTRFERAHAFYRKLGFQNDGVIRSMDDGWDPYQEHFFFIEL